MDVASLSTVLGPFLTSVGAGLSVNGITAAISSYLQSTPAPSIAGLRGALENQIRIDGLNIQADSVINFLAERGYIQIVDTQMHSEVGSVMQTQAGSLFFGHNSTSSTPNTSIAASGRASMELDGNAAVVQNPDGSISFHVGPGNDSSIKFKT